MSAIKKIEKYIKIDKELHVEFVKIVRSIHVDKSAEILGVKHSYISRLINDKQKIRTERLCELIKKLLEVV